MMFTGADGGSSSLPWLASPTWGTSAFSGCLWCRRSRDCPNPLKKFLVAGRPCLQFQSDRHTLHVQLLPRSWPFTESSGCHNEPHIKRRRTLVPATTEEKSRHSCFVPATTEEESGHSCFRPRIQEGGSSSSWEFLSTASPNAPPSSAPTSDGSALPSSASTTDVDELWELLGMDKVFGSE